jgi:hypothetical protein
VKIEDAIIGIAGLDQIFEKLYTSKKSPDDVDGMEMIYLASFYNYIPNGKVNVNTRKPLLGKINCCLQSVDLIFPVLR